MYNKGWKMMIININLILRRKFLCIVFVFWRRYTIGIMCQFNQNGLTCGSQRSMYHLFVWDVKENNERTTLSPVLYTASNNDFTAVCIQRMFRKVTLVFIRQQSNFKYYLPYQWADSRFQIAVLRKSILISTLQITSKVFC